MKGTTRAFRALGLTLVLAASAGAQIRVLPASAEAPLGVPALLLGTPLAPAPVLSAALALQAPSLASLPAPQAAAFLIERAASAAPAERAAAKLAAARLAARPGAREDLRRLADSARRDPALAAWFGESIPAPSLELDGLVETRGAWRLGGKPLERLGNGEFGFVDVHPSIPGTVVKTVAHSASILLLSNPDPRRTAALEERTARALSAADAGPRHFGGVVHAGRLLSVRERVYGETLDALSRSGRLGPADGGLVEDLLRRMAAANLKSDDMRPANVMIGRTLLDPRRRAYLVDGGNLSALPDGLDPEARVRALLDEPIVLRGRFDPNMGFVEFSKTMRLILAEGLERAGRTTRWKRFKGFWADFGRAMIP